MLRRSVTLQTSPGKAKFDQSGTANAMEIGKPANKFDNCDPAVWGDLTFVATLVPFVGCTEGVCDRCSLGGTSYKGRCNLDLFLICISRSHLEVPELDS